jgi:hypothetical protein
VQGKVLKLLEKTGSAVKIMQVCRGRLVLHLTPFRIGGTEDRGQNRTEEWSARGHGGALLALLLLVTHGSAPSKRSITVHLSKYKHNNGSVNANVNARFLPLSAGDGGSLTSLSARNLTTDDTSLTPMATNATHLPTSPSASQRKLTNNNESNFNGSDSVRHWPTKDDDDRNEIIDSKDHGRRNNFKKTTTSTKKIRPTTTTTSKAEPQVPVTIDKGACKTAHLSPSP